MFAVLQDSGKQYKVSKGDVIEVDIRDLPVGAQRLEFPGVLLVGEGAAVKIGQPLVSGAKVIGQLEPTKDNEGQPTLIHKGPKLVALKYKKRKGYHRKIGHREKLLRVRIEEIVG